MARILESALDAIGSTPLIRASRLADSEGFRCNLLMKCECFNAGGSVKDRIAKRMVAQGEADGRLIPGQSVIIEPTSGNTGIGLALQCAIKGYRCIIVMPQKMSQEKEHTLRALGAEVVRTRTEALHDESDSHIMVARRLASEIDHAVILNQYDNPQNALAHYLTTAVEIIEAVEESLNSHGIVDKFSPMQQTLLGPPTPPAEPVRRSSGVVDMLCAGAGTGGTISGVAKRLKEHNPKVLVLGVDPFGSSLAQPTALNVLSPGQSSQYLVEGIGYDFVPGALNQSLVDVWHKVNDEDAFAMCRRLIRTEGILCGGSSGAAMAEAVRFLREDTRGQKLAATVGANVVVILPDSLRNYVTKSWLLEQ